MFFVEGGRSDKLLFLGDQPGLDSVSKVAELGTKCSKLNPPFIKLLLIVSAAEASSAYQTWLTSSKRECSLLMRGMVASAYMGIARQSP